MTHEIYISGRLTPNPEISVTAKGKPMCRLLLECELVREIRRGEFQTELHTIPVTVYSWLVEDIKDLHKGAKLLVGCHLNGTRFEAPGGETKFGVQLVADHIAFPPTRHEKANHASA